MTPAQIKWIAGGVLALLLLFGAYMFGVKTSAPKPEDVSPAAAQSLPGGGVVLARDPGAKQSMPAMETPKGSTIERRVQVVVKPRPIPATATQSAVACPPVTVDLALIKQDGGRRVVASSPDGQVVGGIDVPIEAALNPVEHKWAAGLSVGQDKSPGVWIERDLGRLRFGVEAIKPTGKAIEARARVGWVW